KEQLQAEIKTVNGGHFLAKHDELDASQVKDLAYALRERFDNLCLLLASSHNGKELLTCYISKQLAADKNLNAGQVVRALGKHIQGGGGGQPFFATAGGKNPDGIDKAIEEAISYVE